MNIKKIFPSSGRATLHSVFAFISSGVLSLLSHDLDYDFHSLEREYWDALQNEKYHKSSLDYAFTHWHPHPYRYMTNKYYEMVRYNWRCNDNLRKWKSRHGFPWIILIIPFLVIMFLSLNPQLSP